MRNCPRCLNTFVIEDGYCGRCRECTLSPVPAQKIALKAISALQALEYEVGSSWWARRIGWDWLQELSSRYFAWKVNRKWRRYAAQCAMAESMRLDRRQVSADGR